jgi:hypothetical protein
VCCDCDNCSECGFTRLRITTVNVEENWLEISNDTDFAISGRGLLLTDGENVWRFPAAVIRQGTTVRIRGNSNTATLVLKQMSASFDFVGDVFLSHAESTGNHNR